MFKPGPISFVAILCKQFVKTARITHHNLRFDLQFKYMTFVYQYYIYIAIYTLTIDPHNEQIPVGLIVGGALRRHSREQGSNSVKT